MPPEFRLATLIPMSQFVCSYAHDIACFADFMVEAKSERAALRKIKKALRQGKFAAVNATPAWENGSTNERVFVQGPAQDHGPTTTLEELIGAQHQFSPHTRLCLRCGRDAQDETVKETSCQP